MQMRDYFAALARYHAWATARLLDEHLAHLTDAQWHQDCKLFFGSIHRTVNHLLVTDNLWFARLAEGVSPRMALDTELYHERDPLAAALKAAVRRWSPWLEGLDVSRFDGELAYTRSDGLAMCIPYALALGHAFNHPTHHRGQISAALTGMGRPAPELDWAFLIYQETRSA